MLSADIQLPPYQGHCVKLSVINGAKSFMRAGLLVNPAPTNHEHLELAGYCFLVESQQLRQKVLFDLAFMENVTARAPPSLQPMLNNKDVLRIEECRNIATVLEEHNVDLATINSIIWSHAHIDHTGDPSVFPSSTELIVGPGFKTNYIPGYPTNPQSPVLDSAFQGRSVQELDFSTSSTTIGGFRAIDLFHDSSFWVLETPGHTEHHISALCRTTEDSWVFLGGDVCHSIAQVRPSAFRSLPDTVPADVMGKAEPPESCCCAHLSQHVRKEAGGSFFGLAPGMQEDLSKAQNTLEKLKAFDGRDDVLIVIAHDSSLLDVMSFFPKDMNRWKDQNWAEKGRWKFLRDFDN
ncbi:hypothetical protein HBI57_163740 [Parastagonospora nodorum]|nr:hypothetical protein HBI72_046510 [Parastagonospora nodorum]KAH5696027.1 hypothetical protein HBI44_111870 [Parastagonospora nodorum]KAH6002493.1 hypothetical protein HBI84_089660 [Parastagonospora nodorum]KAH6452331.1 hypothetical protein HBI57_163740 [Parastagonospora nodorum]KAH6491534.1 hypothetical protein HBI58_054530 [Parastagonospora nodorum]